MVSSIGFGRLDEMQDPEITIDRALYQYLKLEYSENWMNQRLKSIVKGFCLFTNYAVQLFNCSIVLLTVSPRLSINT
jgi:hypothetical protein